MQPSTVRRDTARRLQHFKESKTAEAILTLEAQMGELQRLRDAAKRAGQSPSLQK